LMLIMMLICGNFSNLEKYPGKLIMLPLVVLDQCVYSSQSTKPSAIIFILVLW